MAKQHKVSRLIGTQHEVATAAVAADPPWQVEMRPPSSLKPAKRNARTHNEAQIDLLANSILHFGVIRPVVIDDRNRIVAGHGVWEAAKKLGLKRIPVLSENHIRTYSWCSPARIGMATIVPDHWTARCKGASFCNAKCVRA